MIVAAATLQLVGGELGGGGRARARRVLLLLFVQPRVVPRGGARRVVDEEDAMRLLVASLLPSHWQLHGRSVLRIRERLEKLPSRHGTAAIHATKSEVSDGQSQKYFFFALAAGCANLCLELSI